MKASLKYFGLATAVMALTLTACSRKSDSLTGPTAADMRLQQPAQATELGELALVGPDTVEASTGFETFVTVAFEKPAGEYDSVVVFYVQIDTRPESPGFGERQSLKLDASNSKDWGNLITANIKGLEAGFYYKVWIETYNAAGMKRSSHAIAETAIQEEDDIDSAPSAPDTVLVSDAYDSMLKVGFRKPACEHDSLVVFYVKIDVRPESPGFGERQSLKLDASNSKDWGTWITTNLMDVESGFYYKVWVEVYNGDQMARSNHNIGATTIEEEDADQVATRESSVEATPAS